MKARLPALLFDAAPPAVRHGAVSVACFILHLAVMAAADAARIHWTGAFAGSFAVCAVAGFLLHARVTWNVRPTMAGFARYLAGIAFVLPVNCAGMVVFCTLAGLPVLSATIATAVVALGLSFVATRWALVGRGEGRTV